MLWCLSTSDGSFNFFEWAPIRVFYVGFSFNTWLTGSESGREGKRKIEGEGGGGPENPCWLDHVASHELDHVPDRL